MKVITVNGSFIRGMGIDTSISSLLKKIHENYSDIELAILCNEEHGLIEDGFPIGVPLITAERKKLFGYDHFSYFKLLKYIENTDNIIIHAHHPITVWPLLLKKGKKMVTWHGNNNENWNNTDFGPMHKRVIRKFVLDCSTHMFRSLDAIVTISDYLRNELINCYRVPPKRVERIHWGVDTEKFQYSGEDEGYMLFVGRHVRYKNINTLIELAYDLNFPLICVGDDRERSNLENYAKKLRAPVEFKGKIPLNELIRLYQQCSFYVTASKWEGFGLPPIEASACGKPVVVPRNTAHPELVIHSKTGFIYEDNNKLLTVAKALINEKIMRDDMGKAARDYTHQNFNLNNTAAAYVEIYHNLTS